MSSASEKPEAISLSIGTPKEDKLKFAAESGDIDMLYQLLREDKDVLKRIDEMEFVDTPLHIASAAGKTEFAKEMMYLKPSFATKLNKNGWSPLHRALQEGHTGLALSLLKMNKSLVRVKGRNGYTPLHCLVMQKKGPDCLTEFLSDYPECIKDVTSRDETPLHVAAMKNNLRYLKVLLCWLRRTNDLSMRQKQEILNSKNSDGETVLHKAVSQDPPDPETVRLLRNLWININAKNSKYQTALDILISRYKEDGCNVRKCMHILRHRYGLQVVHKMPSYLLELVSQWGYEIKHMSADTGNFLLVVTVLILTATYQAALSPPGGVIDANGGSKHKLQIYFDSNNTCSHHAVEKVEIKEDNAAGSSVLRTQPFLWFFIPNLVAFTTSFIITCLVLLPLISGFFSSVLLLSLSMLLFCLLDSAVIIVSPNNKASNKLLFSVYFIISFTCLFIVPVLIPKARRFLVKKASE